MEVGAIVAVILQDYVDFGLILGLLVFNACLGISSVLFGVLGALFNRCDI